MSTTTILLLLALLGSEHLPPAGCVTPNAPAFEEQQDERPRRIDYVTWIPDGHILKWQVSIGRFLDPVKEEQFVVEQVEKYEIHLHDRIMRDQKGEVREFSVEEQLVVHSQLDWLWMYAVESTEWWRQGHGVRRGLAGTSEESTGVGKKD